MNTKQMIEKWEAERNKLDERKAHLMQKILDNSASLGSIDYEADGWEQKDADLTKEQEKLTAQSNTIAKSLDTISSQLKELREKERRETTADMRFNLPTGESAPRSEKADLKSIYFMRYADEIKGCDHPVIKNIYGGDYRQINLDQDIALNRFFMNRGKIDMIDTKTLDVTYPSLEVVLQGLQSGISESRLAKAIQVEGIDTLGGYAVPPIRANRILTRAAGMTAVRRAGAMVMNINGPMITWPRVTTDSDVYPSAARADYVPEAGTATETNVEFGDVDVKVHTMSFVIKLSTDLLQSVTNMASIIDKIIGDTVAIREDNDFLVGKGTSTALGVLPGGVNALSLTEVNSGHASQLQEPGLRALRRGILTQNRMAGELSYVMNGTTGGVTERFTDGEGRYFWPNSLNPGDRLFGGTYLESEALNDIAANAFPVIAGNFGRGYAIVERGGLRVFRWQDSNTGANQVWFEVRRPVGGAPIQPEYFAVQKIAA
jgi:HK97 family phage major capsid protein